ncbi:MazG nucleotide pyrophosphohydrolase domain-containing protein [Nitrospina gracilis]|uniref:MazG nucleotide pyrophosphohydrolase domain-containing protein n=1 Tax=Nitrospina gracilis TaxID=35801 RepID=UPI0006935072|nr:MazG nucleotide pyrophosphohydrolase domain-containing protein [Nitrospina gracilis]
MFAKLDEEIAEFKEAVRDGDEEHVESELGDILFVLANVARFKKLDAEEALRQTNNKFVKRFHYIEEQVAKQGKELKDTPLEEMERYWQESKNKS